MVELKHCPFCGATRGIYTLDEYGGLTSDNDIIAEIFCDNCKSIFRNERADNGEELIEAWNTRYKRTCKNEHKGNAIAFSCSECGCSVDSNDYYYQDVNILGDFNYCPDCGAKVVK